MRFSNFLFPESATPEHDFAVIHEALQEVELCDQLGFDTIWLAEHHFDGGCVYVDPMTFATAIAARTTQIKIGFAVAQMALHHPIRLAEQVALIDNLSRGRIIVGLGRGTADNFYEYRGYGIAPQEAEARLPEAEEILSKVWTARDYKHHGTYWQLELPEQRPMSAGSPAARETLEHGLIYGSPATVCEQLAALQKIGMGGLILHLRLGPMPWDAAAHSLRLFAEQVAPVIGQHAHSREGL